jgi:hypothetical protein
MNRTIDALRIVFFGIFLLGSAGAFVYHQVWTKPGQACEKAGKWWDARHRVCATPVMISDITGRTPQDRQAEAAARAAIAAPPR